MFLFFDNTQSYLKVSEDINKQIKLCQLSNDNRSAQANHSPDTRGVHKQANHSPDTRGVHKQANNSPATRGLRENKRNFHLVLDTREGGTEKLLLINNTENHKVNLSQAKSKSTRGKNKQILLYLNIFFPRSYGWKIQKTC